MKEFLLRQVALRMHRQKAVRFSREEFNTVLAEELARRDRKSEAQGIAEELLDRSGLFRTQGDGVEFRHLLLQEFFAGRALARTDLQGVIADPWWRRAFVFYCGEYAAQSDMLADLRTWIDQQEWAVKYEAALSLGLGVQASYLVESAVKSELLRWMVEVLSQAKSFVLGRFDETGKTPLMAAVLYYIMGRESVAITLNDKARKSFAEGWRASEVRDEVTDAETLWRIVALQEMGAIEDAASLVRTYRPTDQRLLLGVFLGCVQIRDLRVAPARQRAVAKEMSNRLGKRIPGLLESLLCEIRSTVLEMRKGELKAIGPDGEEASSESVELLF